MRTLHRKYLYFQRKGLTMLIGTVLLFVWPFFVYYQTLDAEYLFFENTAEQQTTIQISDNCSGSMDGLAIKPLSVAATYFYDTIANAGGDTYLAKFILLLLLSLSGVFLFVNLSFINRYSTRAIRFPDGLLALPILLVIAHPVGIELLMTKGGADLILCLFFINLSLFFALLGNKKEQLLYLVAVFLSAYVSLHTHIQSVPILLFIPLCVHYFFPAQSRLLSDVRYTKQIKATLIYIPFVFSLGLYFFNNDFFVPSIVSSKFFASIATALEHGFSSGDMSFSYQHADVLPYSNIPFVLVAVLSVFFAVRFLILKQKKQLAYMAILFLLLFSSMVYLPEFYNNPHPYFIDKEYFVFYQILFIVFAYVFFFIFVDIAWLSKVLKDQHKKYVIAFKLCGIALLFALAISLLQQTDERLKDWQTPYTLLKADKQSLKDFYLQYVMIEKAMQNEDSLSVEELNNAESFLQNMIAQKPDFMPSYFMLSRVYAQQNKSVSLRYQLLKKILQLQPTCTTALDEIFSLIERYNQKEAKILILKDIYKLFPENATVNFKLGQICMEDKMYRRKAIFHFEKTIRNAPQHFLAYYNLGQCYQLIKNNKNALQMYRAALEIQPDNEALKRIVAKLQ